MNKAVFFDRDGVLNIDNDFVTDINQVILHENAAEMIAYCKNLGYKTFIITNQAVVARGMITEQKLLEINEDYKNLLLKYHSSANIDQIYYCPHHPHANLEEYRISCDCRKPKPGMILKAAQEYGIDLSKSFMIGDRISDITAGSLAGCKTIHFLSGKHAEKAIISDLKTDTEIKPDFIINRITELKEIIK
jgi:D-glycero-D-manno-heptose 1,7-bisphosphate phosphatase